MHLIYPTEIERAAKEVGLSMNRVCQDAGVARSAFTRWKNGTSEPVIGTVNKLILAIYGEDGDKAPS